MGIGNIIFPTVTRGTTGSKLVGNGNGPCHCYDILIYHVCRLNQEVLTLMLTVKEYQFSQHRRQSKTVLLTVTSLSDKKLGYKFIEI